MAVDTSSSPSAVHTVALLLIVGTVLMLPSLLLQASSEEDVEVEEEAEEGALASLLGPVLMMMLPISLLVLVRWLASDQAASLAPQHADAATIHRVTGSSPGIIVLIILVLGMISFQSSLQ